MPFRKLAAAISLVATVLAVAGVGASCALAGEAHPFLFSFGSFTDPNGIAVEEATGAVYVADIATGTVSKFDADGSPVDYASLGSNALSGVSTPAKSFSFPTVYGTPAQVAVDNSTDPSDPSRGDLYVMDAGHNVIDKFSSAGAYLSQIIGPFNGEVVGLAVQANGYVVVASEPKPSESKRGGSSWVVGLFDDSATNNFLSAKRRLGLGDGQNGRPLEHGIAVSPTGDYYMLFECHCVERVGRGSSLGELGRVDEGPADIAIGVDPLSGHLYVDEQSSITEWDTEGMDGEYVPQGSLVDVGTGTEVSSFGSSQLLGMTGQQGGIGVNGTTGEIYVANPTDGKVYVFGSITPAAAVGAAANVTQTSATLQGNVDPRGVPVASCEFEYEKVEARTGNQLLSVPVRVFTHRAPCAQTPVQIGSGVSSVGVSAEVSGLEPGVLYDVRLVAGNGNGASPSDGLVATASPGFGVHDFSLTFVNENGTPDTQAGSHPYQMVTSFAFNTADTPYIATADSPYYTRPAGTVKDIIVTPPPGFFGNPNATEAKCPLADLGPGCPPASQVGFLTLDTHSYGSGTYPLFNVVPPRGVAAQFGTNILGFPNAVIDAGLRTGGQYPLAAESVDITAIEPLYSVRTNLFGVVDGKAFLTMPTGCTGPLRSSISVDSYEDPGHYVTVSEVERNVSGEPVTLSGCSQLEFPAAITVAPDVTDASSSSGLTVGVHIPQTAVFNASGLAESSLRDTTVALPAGVAINPAGADGLEACSEGLAGFTGFDEFNPEFEPGVKWSTFTPAAIESLQPGVSLCPSGSKIATVKIKTPLLPNQLEGAVYLASQNENPFESLIAMYMLVEDPISGSTVKLAGEVRLCENAGEVLSGISCQAPGQLVTTFKNTPDLPFEDLQLHFFGGERAPLTTPSRCGTYTTHALFRPWDGNAPAEASSSFVIEHGPNGSPCPGASLPFEPSLTAGTTSNQAGGFSPFTMTMSRADGQQNLQAVSLNMPAGLSGLLTGVELCPEPLASRGTCGPNSLIGETTVSVGVGGQPFSVKGGKVYLTGPYEGAPFGLSIVNPAKAGPYDLEAGTPCDCVLVRARIEVNPVTAALTITSDNEGPYKIPTILKGIPLEIQHVNVTINRPGFTFNPTNCEKTAITGSLDSSEGASDTLSLPFQATNCAALKFEPKFSVATSGKTSRAQGASLTVKLTYPSAPQGAQANISSVKVALPQRLVSRLATLQLACLDTVFAKNPAACPAASAVGYAKATTPLLPVPLEGPAYFVSYGREKFPELVIVLQGYGVTVQLHGETFIDKAGITSSTFRTIPDVPVGTFELNLPEGPHSALDANGNLCQAAAGYRVLEKRVAVHVGGHVRTVTRRVRKRTGGIVMPTAFTAQNGAVINQNTPVAVTGCGKAKAIKARRAARHK